MSNMETKAQIDREFVNSLTSLYSDLNGIGGTFSQFAGGQQIQQTDTLFQNLRWYLISNLRQLLSQLYVEHGIVQTLVDQPVDDAFKAGYELKTGQLDANDVEQLKVYDERIGLTRALMQAIKWARLYGGGGVLILSDQDPATPLNLNKIMETTPLEFRAVDMWELYYTHMNTVGTLAVNGEMGANMGEFYDYYGKPIHKSRVYRIIGKECPAFLRPRLRGWGMSELERLVQSLNSYMKNNDVIFELLDEAKVDVHRIKGFNTALINADGTSGIQKRIQLANMMKNFQNALIMDKEDEWEQKQIAFSGLSEVLLQIRQGLAADLKMPMTKLFGISAAGFNSGEDDIENYNSMVDGEIRAKNKFSHIDLLQIACKKKFGVVISDLMLEYPSLRQLNAKEQEEVKDSQFNRVMSTYQSGLEPDTVKIKEAINADSLLPVELDVNSAAGMPLEGDFAVQGSAKGDAGKKTPKED